jgi:outer membrane protein OmpA-like peptidoglycan-associated protein
MAWLVSKGIAKSRLTGKGYGESQLVNDCGCEPTNASPCSEEQHQENRRSEFVITKL